MQKWACAVCKECLVSVLGLLGVFTLFRWLNRNHLVILTYHGVLPSTSGVEGDESRNVVDQENFAWQMRYLAKHFRCLPLEEAVELLGSNRPLPPYSVVVTFDDGFRNNLQYAFPILRRCGVPATIFLTTGHIGRGTQLLWTEHVGRLLGATTVPQTVTLPVDPKPLTLSLRTAAERGHARSVVLKRLKGMPCRQRDDLIQEIHNQLAEPNEDRYAFLDWNEARQLAQGGMTIGSHTVEHPILASLDDGQRNDEVVESKREIERQLGIRCMLFSYPNGTAHDFDDRDKANLRKAGYVAAVTQIVGVNDRHTDRFALRRLNIGHGHGPQLFIAQVSGFGPWLRSTAVRWSNAVAASRRVLAETLPNAPL